MQTKTLAEALGLSRSMVSRLHKRGMPRDTVEAAQHWRSIHLEAARLKGTRMTIGASPAEPADEDSLEGDDALYRRARARREQIRAQREGLELRRLRGSLIELDEIQRVSFTAYRALRDQILNVPARIRDRAAAEGDPLRIEAMIEAELVAALSSFDPTRLVDDPAEADDAG